MDFKALFEAVQTIGLPGVLCLGLTVILYQQTGVLKQIRDSIDRLHDTVVGRQKVSPSDAPLREARSEVHSHAYLRND
jgi:hypothetical protein